MARVGGQPAGEGDEIHEMTPAGSAAALDVAAAVSHTGSQTARAGPAGMMTQATSVQAAIARSDVAGHASHLLWMHLLASTPTAAPPRPARPIVPSAEVVAPEPRLLKAGAAGAQPSPPMLSRYSVLASRQPALRVHGVNAHDYQLRLEERRSKAEQTFQKEKSNESELGSLLSQTKAEEAQMVSQVAAARIELMKEQAVLREAATHAASLKRIQDAGSTHDSKEGAVNDLDAKADQPCPQQRKLFMQMQEQGTDHEEHRQTLSVTGGSRICVDAQSCERDVGGLQRSVEVLSMTNDDGGHATEPEGIVRTFSGHWPYKHVQGCPSSAGPLINFFAAGPSSQSTSKHSSSAPSSAEALLHTAHRRAAHAAKERHHNIRRTINTFNGMQTVWRTRNVSCDWYVPIEKLLSPGESSISAKQRFHRSLTHGHLKSLVAAEPRPADERLRMGQRYNSPIVDFKGPRGAVKRVLRAP